MTEALFPAMGGVIEVQMPRGTARDIERVHALFEGYERALSRFLADSELSALNCSQLRPFRASPALFDAVSEAIGWACATDGVFDPTLLDALEASGYDRPFEEMRGAVAVIQRRRVRCGGWREIALDHEHETILMPAGVRIDLGGIGKGYTVDRAIGALGVRPNALINASGDLYAAGDGPEGEGWLVGVQNPFAAAGDDLAVLRVRNRGVATSGSTRRRWEVGGAHYHHLIDPREGRPSRSDLLTATVVAPTATQADVLAKTAFMLGTLQGPRFVERFEGSECLGVTASGDVVTTPGLAEYLA